MLSSLAGRFLHPKQNNVRFQKIVRQSWLYYNTNAVKGWSFISCWVGRGVLGEEWRAAILRKLRRFPYQPPLHPSFLEMILINFAYCESDSTPHPIAVESTNILLYLKLCSYDIGIYYLWLLHSILIHYLVVLLS